MAVTLQGVRVTSFSVERDDEGGFKIGAQYELVSSLGKVVAKQSIGKYQNMTIKPSPETELALQAFLSAYNSDIGKTLGLDVE